MIHWDLGYPFTPPWKYEILDYFFKNNGLTPIFLECNDTSGVLNKNTGEWNGCVGMVRFPWLEFHFNNSFQVMNDEADLGVSF